MQQVSRPSSNIHKPKFSPTIAKIAGEAISKKGYVSAIDLFLGIGWVTKENVENWRSGRIPYLEKVITANLNKISRTMKEFRTWATHSNLKPSLTVYKHRSHKLRFSKSGNENIEKAYSTHFVHKKTNEVIDKSNFHVNQEFEQSSNED